jgi:maltooligosyltrehalose trehalohydrolase
VELVLDDGRTMAMDRARDGTWSVRVPGLQAGARYRFALDGRSPMPDPASRFQPEGVHGPSEVIDPSSYRWHDEGWKGRPLDELVIYELHVGTFTPEGTFDAARARLRELAELGITALELMPLHDFPGQRGWGYDPAAFWAPCRAYGRPDDLRRFVDVAHSLGMSVLLDVVYNHLGPDGAYWAAYGPVFTDRHHTPWGRAMNLDGRHARGVRELIVGNALYWMLEHHIDGLRLDATFALVDDSEEHLLAELSREVDALPGPPRFLIAEDERNLAKLVEPRAQGGYGLHGVWADDFHHVVRRIATGDSHGYFRDYPSDAASVARCIEQRWLFTGRADELWLGERRGTPADHLPPERFVYCIQNHDQIGNRPKGERLNHVVDLSVYRAASALLLFSPEMPLLFMGQEYAATTPFLYFTDHEPKLGRQVTEGRKREFKHVPGFDGEVPDPQAEATFRASVLDWSERERSPHREILALYRDLLALRAELRGEDARATSPAPGVVQIERGRHVLMALLSGRAEVPVPWPGRVRLDTQARAYGGDAQPLERVRDTLLLERPRALVLERA